MITQNLGGLFPNQDPFPYISKRLAADGLKVGLSFGGGVAQDSDWNFGFNGTASAAQMASDLATWAKSIGVSNIDFDIENPNFGNINQAADVSSFFSTLHSQMSTSLTVDASTGGFESMFGPILTQGHLENMFNDMNLMCYGGSSNPYYLNSGTSPATGSETGWGLVQWVDLLQKNNSHMTPAECAAFFHIGFLTSLNYGNPSESGGPCPYTPPAPSGVTSSGQYAAYIYSILQSQLREYYNDPELTLSAPFFWQGDADYDVDSGPTAPDNSEFFKNNPAFESDFFAYLNSAKKE